VAEKELAEEILPIRQGLVNGGGDLADQVRLLGSKCADCSEVSIGSNSTCPNCGSENMRSLELASHGVLWTYTVIRHKPPGDYLGPEPFAPFALGLVELPDGVRIMAPIDADIDRLKIGARLSLRTWMLRSRQGQLYRAFRFRLADR